MKTNSVKKNLVRYLLAAGIVAAITVPTSAGSFNPYKIGAYKATHQSVYNKYILNRGRIGDPLLDETDVVSNATGARGSRMVFTNGIIFRIENGAYPGKTTVISGDLRRQYEQSGGLNGQLGFPIGDKFQSPNAAGKYNQKFERGAIVWRPDLGRYYVLIYP